MAKRKGERYKLVWKNRVGFARLAINYGYPIIPFASVGADDAVDIVLDADNPLLAPERLFVEKVLGSPDSWPIWRGIGPTPIPRPKRQYYWFGEPIDTTSVRGCQDDDARCARCGIPPRPRSSTAFSSCSRSGNTTRTARYSVGCSDRSTAESEDRSPDGVQQRRRRFAATHQEVGQIGIELVVAVALGGLIVTRLGAARFD